MKLPILLLSAMILSACTFGGFKPPIGYGHWKLLHFPLGKTAMEVIDKRIEDMRECGIDITTGEHLSIKQGLCMEEKGYYHTKGPVCAEWGFTEADPMYQFCREWRAKRGLPDPVAPWDKQKNPPVQNK